MASEIYTAWRAAGIVAAVRVNPLETEGRADLVEVMRGRPDVVIMSKVAEPEQVVALGEEVERLEKRFNIPPGSTELAPNIKSARGIMQTYAIAELTRGSPVFLARPKTWQRISAHRAARRLLNLLMRASACTSNAPRLMFFRSTARIHLRIWKVVRPTHVTHGSWVIWRKVQLILIMRRSSTG